VSADPTRTALLFNSPATFSQPPSLSTGKGLPWPGWRRGLSFFTRKTPRVVTSPLLATLAMKEARFSPCKRGTFPGCRGR